GHCFLIFAPFRLIYDGVGSAPAVSQVLRVKQTSKVIFVPLTDLITCKRRGKDESFNNQYS
ncbi:hypothetical protein, partial [Enterococcus mundtii]|uniref:hypothetical protein n=1 Tax=Enterococcus mundtii TaxID=53346 RepID=UPI001E659527